MQSKLKIGDEILWSGSWGSAAPKKAKVTGIEQTELPRQKEGRPVSEIEWSKKDYCVVDLENGHWAYGYQLKPIN